MPNYPRIHMSLRKLVYLTSSEIKSKALGRSCSRGGAWICTFSPNKKPDPMKKKTLPPHSRSCQNALLHWQSQPSPLGKASRAGGSILRAFGCKNWPWHFRCGERRNPKRPFALKGNGAKCSHGLKGTRNQSNFGGLCFVSEDNSSCFP